MKNRMKKAMMNLVYYVVSTTDQEMTLLTGSSAQNAYRGYRSVAFHVDIALTVRMMTLFVLPVSLDRNNYCLYIII